MYHNSPQDSPSLRPWAPLDREHTWSTIGSCLAQPIEAAVGGTVGNLPGTPQDRAHGAKIHNPILALELRQEQSGDDLAGHAGMEIFWCLFCQQLVGEHSRGVDDAMYGAPSPYLVYGLLQSRGQGDVAFQPLGRASSITYGRAPSGKK